MNAPKPPPPLFYHPDLNQPGGRAQVTDQEAVHIFRARRLGKGDTVHLTDGNGTLASCQLVSFVARPLTLELVIEKRETIQPAAVERVLAAALPKSESQSVMLDMATQLGMNRFIPLRCEHSVVGFQPRMRDRWQRIIRSACKQCRQCHFPLIDEQTDLATLLKTHAAARMLFGDRDGRSMAELDHGALQSALQSTPQIVLLVGPEGGFSDAESARLARCGVQGIALGAQVLRTETAAVALLAAANQLCD